VREQIRVAEGEPLSFSQHELRMVGHAIEARLYAENPARDFFPSPGTVLSWRPPSSPALRVDSGVETGTEISVHYDPLIAKVVAHAPTRTEAALALALGLERFGVLGLQTNRDYLVDALRSGAFLAGDTTTDFIERAGPPRTRTAPVDAVHFAAVAAAIAEGGEHAGCPETRFAIAGTAVTIDVSSGNQVDRSAMIDGKPVAVRLFAAVGETMDLEVAGRRQRVQVVRSRGGWLTHDGTYELAARHPEE
jgi:propionyl-CoA carboxylase alpha chain